MICTYIIICVQSWTNLKTRHPRKWRKHGQLFSHLEKGSGGQFEFQKTICTSKFQKHIKFFFHHCRRSSQMDYRLLLMEGIRCNFRKLAPRIIRSMSTVVGINKQHCHEENLNTANNMKRQTYKNDFRCRR